MTDRYERIRDPLDLEDCLAVFAVAVMLYLTIGSF